MPKMTAEKLEERVTKAQDYLEKKGKKGTLAEQRAAKKALKRAARKRFKAKDQKERHEKRMSKGKKEE